jgi:hypothetical protein
MTTDNYATAKPFLGALPAWIASDAEKRRVASYALYEAMYWNVPDTFKLVSRGAEDKPIYVPSGKGIIETMHRYLAPSLTVVCDEMYGTPQEQVAALQVWNDLARRERFASKFNSNKRYGLIRGDSAFMLSGNPIKEPGTKISILPVDPSSIFPIENPAMPGEIIGYHIAEEVQRGDKTFIRRLTYRKETGMGGPSPITMEDALYEVDAWGGPGMLEEEAKVVEVLSPLVTLPQPIDSLPIYMIPNFEIPNSIYGASEMKGLERMMAAVNQSVSDEELTLALEGLGVYWTDSGSPVDENGEETDWNLGPARVVEVPTGKKMNRLNGASSMAPYQEHIKMLMDMLYEGTPAVARGTVNVQAAESGIALLLELSPILARAEEKELTITDRLGNMFFDLPKWLVAYEGGIMNPLLNVRMLPTYGDKIPPNRSKDLADLLTIAKATPQIVPMKYIRQRMRSIGFDDLPDDATLEAEILAEQEARARVQQDAFGVAVDREVNADLNSSNTTPEEE